MNEPIYLCTQDELFDTVDEERAMAQMRLLASIVEKLGYRLASGEAPNYDELWALPADPPSPPLTH